MTPVLEKSCPSSLSCCGLSHSFGEMRSLNQVQMRFVAGQIHAIFGENGAGKTTLLRCLAGLLKPYAGEIAVAGFKLPLGSSKTAAAAGIGLLTQSSSLAEDLSIFSNLAHACCGFGLIRKPPALARMKRLLHELGCQAEPFCIAGQLSVGERKLVELARLIFCGRKILLLDEPSAALADSEENALYRRLRTLAEQGSTVIITGHKIERLLPVVDTASVFRAGSLVFSKPCSDTHPEQVRNAMFGVPSVLNLPAKQTSSSNKIALELSALVVARFTKPINLRVYQGEIVGLTGIAGSGQRELMEALMGFAEPTGGQILIAGLNVPVSQRRAAGLRCIPEEPAADACMPSMTVAENLVLHDYTQPPQSRMGFLCSKMITARAQRIIDTHQLAVPSPSYLFSWLSGGNQRKLLIARETEDSCGALAAHNPSAGLDRRSLLTLTARLKAMRAAGCGILLLAEDNLWLAETADRILTINASAVHPI